jgi:hypothetical protein
MQLAVAKELKFSRIPREAIKTSIMKMKKNTPWGISQWNHLTKLK